MKRAIVEEVVMVMDPESDHEEVVVAVGSAGSDELEAKTQENTHPTQPTVRDDREASTGDERGVHDNESSGEPEKEDSRHASEEVSSSESDEMDVEEMATDDEEELWR